MASSNPNAIYTLMVGDAVQGTYHGVPYTGRITASRPHSINHKITLFDVALDAPIEVYGTERTSIHFAASHDDAARVKFNGGIDHDPTPIERRDPVQAVLATLPREEARYGAAFAHWMTEGVLPERAAGEAHESGKGIRASRKAAIRKAIESALKGGR